MKPSDFKQVLLILMVPSEIWTYKIVLKKWDFKSPAIWFCLPCPFVICLYAIFYDYYCLVSVFGFIYMALVGMLLFAHGSVGNSLD